MKKILFVVFLVFGSMAAQAQGTVVFNNRISGQIVAPIYGPELGDNTLMLRGNSASGTPPGATIYTGSLVEGDGYTAELMALVSGSWISVATTTFRSGLGAGFIQPTTDPAIAGVAAGETVMLQLRAWENRTLDANPLNDINSWADLFSPANTTALRGDSLSFLSLPLGGVPSSGPPITSPNMLGLQSFNMAVPEPSTWVLLSLGAGLLLCFRQHRKP